MKKLLIGVAIVAVLYFLWNRMKEKEAQAQQQVKEPGELEPQIIVSPASSNPNFVNMENLATVTPVVLMQAENLSAPSPQNFLQTNITV